MLDKWEVSSHATIPSLLARHREECNPFTYSPPTLSGYQWTVSTSTSYIQWLSLAKRTLKVTPTGRNRSLVARTNKCGWAITPHHRPHFTPNLQLPNFFVPNDLQCESQGRWVLNGYFSMFGIKDKVDICELWIFVDPQMWTKKNRFNCQGIGAHLGLQRNSEEDFGHYQSRSHVSKSKPITCCDCWVFLYWFEEYSIDSSKMIGNFLEVLNFN